MDTKVSLDLGGNVVGMLERLASQIGVTADKVFPWYVKQQVIYAGSALVLWVLFVTVFLGMIAVSWRKPFLSANGEHPSFLGVCRIVGCIGIFVAMLAVISEGPTTIAGFLNPEYGAVRKIILTLHGK